MYIKKIPLLPFFAALLALLVGCSETVMSDLVMRNGLAYQRGGGLFSGDVVSYFPQSPKEIKDEAKRRVSVQGSFSDGRKEGDWTTYKWNKEYQIIPYENGKRHGNAKWFHTNGTLKHEQRYANDMKHGSGAFYNPNYNSRSKDPKTNQKIIRQVFYERGRLVNPRGNRKVSKLSASDAEPSGPGFFKVVFDLLVTTP